MPDLVPGETQQALQLTRAGAGYFARLDSAYPIVARLTPESDGWTVNLTGVSFTAQVETIARRLPSLDAARAAALIALETARVLEGRDDYRFRRQSDGPNRWYTDRTVRQPATWNGRLPDLGGSDATVTARGDLALGYLDATFPHLVNLAQHRPHFDPARGRTTDPNEHTIEVLAMLNTAGLAAEDAPLARIAVLYHDVGKGLDAFDPQHPLESARLAAPLLAHFDLSPEQKATVLLQIREHDLLGVYSRRRMSTEEALRRLDLAGRPANLDLHAAIATADISAIRGLRWVVNEGRIAHARLELASRVSVAR